MFAWKISTRHTQSVTLHILLATLALSAILWGIFMGMYALSVVVLLLVGVSLFIHNNSPEDSYISITDQGLTVDEKFFDWTQMGAYSLKYYNGEMLAIRFYFRSANILFRVRDIDVASEIPSQEIDAFLSSLLERRENIEIGYFEKMIGE